ncbi:LysR substrate binding domain protein [Caballeronia sordidicola]|uniref:LysR substrate binding domain protein n=1 Tax=Caballeronia sordidicola TaxID=196367 RepID=A0A158IE77_CABSO|nr:LysR substrate-binding domain-containing protein [Caballeronia sordidicola]SAL54703.1 LysR substrate binding domain protein [Caballeronia sordidicola]
MNEAVRCHVEFTTADSNLVRVFGKSAHPQSQIEIVDRPPSELHRMVEEGDLDATFGIFFSRLSGVDRVPLFPMQLVSVSALENARLGHCTRGNWRALEGVPLITLPKASPFAKTHRGDACQGRGDLWKAHGGRSYADCHRHGTRGGSASP